MVQEVQHMAKETGNHHLSPCFIMHPVQINHWVTIRGILLWENIFFISFNWIVNDFPVTMKTQSLGCVSGVTRAVGSALGPGRTAAWAALWVFSSCGKKAVAWSRALRDTTRTPCTGPVSPAMAAARHAQVYCYVFALSRAVARGNNFLGCLSKRFLRLWHFREKTFGDFIEIDKCHFAVMDELIRTLHCVKFTCISVQN